MMDPTRERLAKLFGRLGSDAAAERSAALAAIDKALTSSGMTWAWICDLVALGEAPGHDGLALRDGLLARLVGERVGECLAGAWSLTIDEAKAMQRIRGELEAGTDLRGVSSEEIAGALRIADVVRRRVGRR